MYVHYLCLSHLSGLTGMINDVTITKLNPAPRAVAPGLGGFVAWCEQELQTLRAQTGMHAALAPQEAARIAQKISGLQALIAKYAKQTAA
jgi:hypothetical protein